MQISTITQKFVGIRDCRGAQMVSRFNSENKSQLLTHKHSGNPIAEIYEYKDSKNFRLRLFPYTRYDGKTSHNNRVCAVLRNVQMPTDSRDWDLFRYSTHVRYSVRVYDRKLNIEFDMKNPMEFVLRDGKLTLDYNHLESFAYPDTPSVVVAPVVSENSNLSTVTTQLNAILAGV